jgi:hypothetical protein
VRARFDAMWIIHWNMSCVNPSVEQTFNLVFENTKPAITPDGTFKDVPIGMDPTQWPLDVDVAKTTAAAQSNPLYPGGQFSVYGDFCWSGDKTRAEAYFVPAGTQPSGAQNSRDPEAAKKAMQQLQAQHMLGTAVAAGDTYVTFNVPDDDKALDGTGDNMVARVVVYDNKAHRASAVDAKTVLSLKGQKKPLSVVLIAGVAGLLVVVILLVMVLMRSGGGGKKRGGGTPPAPPGYGPPPGGGYGAPPPGYGAPPPPAGGYGATPVLTPAAPPSALAGQAVQAGGQPLFAMAARPPAQGTEPTAAVPAAMAAPADSGLPPVVQVRCPGCGMNTMATPGQSSFCFSCGQPLPGEMTRGGGGGVAPGFLEYGRDGARAAAARAGHASERGARRHAARDRG